MSRRAPAEERIYRLLYLIPAAVRATEEEGSASISELAEAVGASEEEVIDDLAEVKSRAFTHPAGEGDRIQITVEAGRVQAWTAGEFRRPVKLTPREALALAAGLRALAFSSDGRRSGREGRGRLELIRRLERELATLPVDQLAERIAVEGPEAEDEPVLSVLSRAVRESRVCRLRYLKFGADEPEERLLAPYRLVHAEGRWYAIGRSRKQDDVRIFRLDRVLEAALTEASFREPGDFDPADYLSDGRLFRAEEEVEATVRYSPVIARWIRERWDSDRAESRRDGSVVVCHQVADPDWLVRHVLRYAGEAEVVEPAELRAFVREVAERMAE